MHLTPEQALEVMRGALHDDPNSSFLLLVSNGGGVSAHQIGCEEVNAGTPWARKWSVPDVITSWKNYLCI